MASRLPAPTRPETRAMPADKGVRLNDRQSIANSREQPIETNEYQTVDGTEGEFLWSSPPQDVYLLPQRPNLCLERCPRPEQIDDCPTNKSAKIPHPTTGLPDSRSTASQMRFATGTASGANSPLNGTGNFGAGTGNFTSQKQNHCRMRFSVHTGQIHSRDGC